VKLSYLFLLVGPAILYALGFVSNAAVMAVNGGQMPVQWPGGCSEEVRKQFSVEQLIEGMEVHSCMTKDTKLRWLADWIVIRHAGVASPGDFLEWGGDYAQVPCWFLLAAFLFKDRAFHKA
jgi:Family of unknown function (DUF5317)